MVFVRYVCPFVFFLFFGGGGGVRGVFLFGYGVGWLLLTVLSCADDRGCGSGPGPGASSFFWDDVRDPLMQVPGDVLLVFDCTALPGARAEQLEMRVEAGMVSSPSTKQLLGVCVPSWYHDHGWAAGLPGDDMTQSLCRALDGMGDVPGLSVHRLCSLMREDLRDTQLASVVFVSQLGGGQLLDIYLPRLATSPRTTRQSMTLW